MATLSPGPATLIHTQILHIALAVFRPLDAIAYFRTILAAGLLVLATSAVVSADEHIQDWIPDVLILPEDAEVETNRSVGSSIRLFSFSTAADLDALLPEWRTALTENGYQLTEVPEELVDQSIEFEGPGITNAKIIVSPAAEDNGRRLVEFDATLN